MVMDGGAAEDPFPGQFETGYLKHHGNDLHHEHAAHNDQQQFLLHQYGDQPDHTAQRQTACIPHEHGGGVTVEPEEADARADQSGRKHHHFRSAGNIIHTQILRKDPVPGHVSKDAIRQRAEDHTAGAETVLTISQVHGVGSAHHHQCAVKIRQPYGHSEKRALHKGHGKLRKCIRRDQVKRPERPARAEELQDQFRAPADPVTILAEDFVKVINKPDCAVCKERTEEHCGERVGKIAPQTGGDHNGKHDQQPTHAGGLSLLLVDKLIIHKTFQPFRSDGVFQHPHGHGTKDHAKEECGQQGGTRAESGVINKAQRRIFIAGPEMDQIIKHIFSSSR